jgi:hypothetical protein
MAEAAARVTPERAMIQISYLSQASAPMSADQLIALLMQCRTNNAERGLTGMLLYGNGTFLQVLEGEDAVGGGGKLADVFYLADGLGVIVGE